MGQENSVIQKTMDTITINKKEYRELQIAKDRLETLLNIKSRQHLSSPRAKHESFTDLVGALSDVEQFKGKTSVEVQHMIPDLWSKKRSS